MIKGRKIGNNWFVILLLAVVFLLIPALTPSDAYGATTISVDKGTYLTTDAINVTATSSEQGAWVGIYKATDSPGDVESYFWYYVDAHNGSAFNIYSGDVSESKREGIISGSKLPKGDYIIYVMPESGYSKDNYLAKKAITIVDSYTISSKSSEYSICNFTSDNSETNDVLAGKIRDHVLYTTNYKTCNANAEWVGLYTPDATPGVTEAVVWCYLSDPDGKYTDVAITGGHWSHADWYKTGKGFKLVLLSADSKVLAQTTINLVDHKWNSGSVTKAATCTATGIKTYTCTVSGCGKTKTETIQMTAHVQGPAATCVSAQTCKNCDYKFADKLTTHSWNDGVINQQSTCASQGTKIFTCKVTGCGQTKTEVLDKSTTHTSPGAAATCLSAQTCNTCGAIIEPKKSHTMTSVSGSSPTCTTSGVVAHYYCSSCKTNYSDAAGSQVLTTTVASALGHNPGWQAEVKATCTSDGMSGHYRCSRCGGTFTDYECKIPTNPVITATGHSMTKYIEVAATCTTSGTREYYYCSNCQKNYKDTVGSLEYQNADITIPSLGHSFTSYAAKPATCIVDGTVAYQFCSRCKKNYDMAGENTLDSIVDLAGHQYQMVSANEATCKTPGNIAYKVCKRDGCGQYFDNDNNPLTWAEIATPQKAHVYSIEKATCTEDKKCSKCSYVEEYALGHKFSNPTCTESGMCSVCNELDPKGAPLDHDWKDADCETAKTCSRCGETDGQPLNHDWKDADCENPKTCSRCNETEGEKLGHTPGAAATCNNTQVCTVCSYPLTMNLGHLPNINKATCTEDQVCIREGCGAILEEHKGHSEGQPANCVDPQICTVCLVELVPALGHKYNDFNCEIDNVCIYCPHIEGKGEHVPADDPTCKHAQFCEKCGKQIAEPAKHIPDIEHATCEKVQKCLVCEAILQEIQDCTPDEANPASCKNAQYCLVCGKVTQEQLKHVGGAAATCTTQQTCTLCGEQMVAALGHAPGAAATCTTNQICGVCKEVLVEAKGHVPGDAATCTTPQKCTRDDCDEILVPALRHTPFGKATCTQPQVCKTCGVTLKGALGHKYGPSATCTEDQICTECYEVLVEKKGHTPGSVSCTEKQVCLDCGEEFEDVAGHTPGVPATCVTAQICMVCGEILDKAKGHDFIPGTCKQPEKCKTCGAEGSIGVHVPGEASCKVAQTCTLCDAYLGPAAQHTPGEAATCTNPQTCTVCGAIVAPKKAHILETLASKAATCTETGLTAGRKCTICGTVTKEQQTIPAKDHSVIKVSAMAATCTKTGLTAGKECIECGKVLEGRKTIAKKAHKKKVVTLKTATRSRDGKITTRCEVCNKKLSTSVVPRIKTVEFKTKTLTYNGKQRMPKLRILSSKGKIIGSKYYTVIKASGRKNVGTYTCKVKFKGRYSGTYKVTFKINPAKPTIKKPKAAKKAITVKWGKVKTQASGYQVMYSTSKKFKGNKTVFVKKAKTTSKTIKKLKSKKTYYVKVRTYRLVKGKKYYSAWSKVQKVKTK